MERCCRAGLGLPHAAVHRAAAVLGAPTFEADPIKATYQFYLGLIIVGMGVLALRAQWRNQGLGALIGAWAVGTVVLFDMVNTFQGIGSAGAGGAFLPGFAAPLVLLAAGGFAVTEIRRGSGLKFAAFSLSDRARLLVLAAAVLGALVLLRLALDQYSDDQPGWGLLGLWLAILALWVPVAAVLARPVVLGRWMLIGWSLGCAAPVLGMWLYWEGYNGDSQGLWFADAHPRSDDRPVDKGARPPSREHSGVLTTSPRLRCAR